MRAQALKNLERLRATSYIGRLILQGISEDGLHIVQATALTGRGENSRNRVLVEGAEGHVFTESADPSKVGDTSYTLYSAMRETGSCYIVSNGDQTDTVIAGLRRGLSFDEALRGRGYEDDPPIYTPRITGLCSMHAINPLLQFSLLRKDISSDTCLRNTYPYDAVSYGLGLCLTTYTGDGDPPPTFDGAPYLLPLPGGLYSVARSIWGSLNKANRVSLAVKFIDRTRKGSKIKIINKYKKV